MFSICGCAKQEDAVKNTPQSNTQNITQTETYKTALKGDAEAQFNLGGMYYNGQGVEKDLKKAYEWISKSAEQDKQYEEVKKVIEKELAELKSI
jgi:TPR repeat protein